jgi:hypothetical protein
MKTILALIFISISPTAYSLDFGKLQELAKDKKVQEQAKKAVEAAKDYLDKDKKKDDVEVKAEEKTETKIEEKPLETKKETTPVKKTKKVKKKVKTI